jgi:hypothetical protein
MANGAQPVWRWRWVELFTGLLFLSSTLACNSLGVFSPTPTAQNQVDLAGTVAALNATFEAIQNRQTQLASPTPVVIIVTATATNTPVPSPTPIETPTPFPTATSIPPTPVPIPTHTPAAPGRTIVIMVTPTSPPTPTPYPEAPIIVSPPQGAIVAKGEDIILHWGWNGLLLHPDEYYEIKIRPDGQSRSAYIAQERGLAHNFRVNLGAGRYVWTVQIVQGYWKNNSGHPDDWVFVRIRSAESQSRLLLVDGRHDDDDD